MNLRTIAFWAIYNPKAKMVLATHPTKKYIVERCNVPEGCVVVQMKGHYLPPRPTDSRTKEK
jgi:hypothetical protein